MEATTYTVRNKRLNAAVTLYGRTLAPAQVGGRTNSTTLTYEQLLGSPCVAAFARGWLVYVGPDSMPAALQKAVKAAQTIPAPAPVPAPVVSPTVAPVVSPPAPTETKSVQSSSQETENVPVVEKKVEPVPVVLEYSTEEELLAYKAPELQAFATSLGLSSEGTKAEIVKRILDLQDAQRKEPEHVSQDYTESGLMALKVAELQDLADSLGLPTEGTKAEITKRILDLQAEVPDASKPTP